MGLAITDVATADLLHQLNQRFSIDGPLEEMVVIQKEFGVFSPKNSLKQAFRLLHIVPSDFKQRRYWYLFLEGLKKYSSDKEGVSGHDRILEAYQSNLESKEPLPVHMTTHKAADDKRILVSRGNPVIYETQAYLCISIPTVPADVGRAARAKAKAKGKVKAKAKKK